MSYTLISMVGTGMYIEKNGEGKALCYKKTDYLFPNGRRVETDSFLNAIFKSECWEIGKVILIGTLTSRWGALIDKDKDKELWNILSDENVCVEENSPLHKRIENHIQERFSADCNTIIHTDKLDSDTIEGVFDKYKHIVPLIPLNHQIIFDITHSFRSMALLVYQALQFVFQRESVNIIYGEFINIESKKVSCVRTLSPYWKYSQINEAITIFENKLDGFRLAELIKDDWKEGAEIINNISGLVQTNFSLLIPKMLRNTKKLLDNSDIKIEKTWFKDIKKILLNLCKLLADTDSRTILNYANHLKSKDLNTQAVIALETAVETFLAEKSGDINNIGNYDWWIGENGGKEQRNKLINKHKLYYLHKLHDFRNQIAHGGGRDKDKQFPDWNKTSDIYKESLKAVKKLFNIRFN